MKTTLQAVSRKFAARAIGTFIGEIYELVTTRDPS